MSPITLGILAASGAATVGSYELITSTILSSNAASVTFSNLGTAAAAYKHLQLRAIARDAATTAGGTYLKMQVNGDAGSNYSYHSIVGSSGTPYATATPSTNSVSIGRLSASGGGNTTAYSSHITDLLDFNSISKNKSFRTMGGAIPDGYIMFFSGAWYSTSAITSLSIFSDNGSSLATGSRFSLYGIRG